MREVGCDLEGVPDENEPEAVERSDYVALGFARRRSDSAEGPAGGCTEAEAAAGATSERRRRWIMKRGRQTGAEMPAGKRGDEARGQMEEGESGGRVGVSSPRLSDNVG